MLNVKETMHIDSLFTRNEILSCSNYKLLIDNFKQHLYFNSPRFSSTSYVLWPDFVDLNVMFRCEDIFRLVR